MLFKGREGVRGRHSNLTNVIKPITRYASTPILFAITGDDTSKPDVNTNNPNQPIPGSPNLPMQPTTIATITSTTSLNSIATTTQLPSKDNNHMNKIATTQSPQSFVATENIPDQNLQTTTARPLLETTTISQIPTPENNQDLINNNNLTKPDLTQSKVQSILDMSMIIYSAFIVYIAFIKLIYHNFHLINQHFTEPGLVSTNWFFSL